MDKLPIHLEDSDGHPSRYIFLSSNSKIHMENLRIQT
jgi:hypothetical protein